MGIRVISFDFWNTLYKNSVPLKHERAERIQRSLAKADVQSVSKEAILSAMQKAWDVWDQIWVHEQRTLAPETWVGIVLEHLGVNLPDGAAAELCDYLGDAGYPGISQPIAKVRELIPILSKDHGLAVISDTGVASGRHLRRLMDRDGLGDDHFGIRVFSDEEGRSKPHASLFKKVLDHFHVEPDQMVHIGDLKQTDVAGAAALGIHTIRFAGAYDDTSPSAYPEAEIILYDYADLSEILRGL